MLYFDVCLVVRCAVCVCVGFLERMCMSVRSRVCPRLPPLKCSTFVFLDIYG